MNTQVDYTNILPEEVWRVILERVDSADLLNCCRTSSKMWINIYGGTKTVWLFERVYGHIIPYFSPHEALLCRSVCKAWRKTVDAFLENHEYHTPPSTEKGPSILRVEENCWDIFCKQLYEVNLESDQRLNSFCAEMECYPKNPFVGRSVSLKYSYATIQFLQKFGKLIWHLKITLKNTGMYYAGPLLSCLESTPYLKKLEVVGGSYGHIEVDEVMQYCQIRDTDQINLPHLKSLVLQFSKEVSVVDVHFFVNQLFKRDQLERLIIRNSETFSWVTVGWSKLTDLDIVRHSNFQLENLAMLKAPLKRCTLRLKMTDISWVHIQLFLEQVKETLGYLSIETFFSDWLNAKNEIRIVNLPNLKTLQIINCVQATRNLILGLGGESSVLLNLHIGWDHMGEGDRSQPLSLEEQRKQITECLGELHSDNPKLWRHFKKLQVFTWESYDSELIEKYTKAVNDFKNRFLLQ